MEDNKRLQQGQERPSNSQASPKNELLMEVVHIGDSEIPIQLSTSVSSYTRIDYACLSASRQNGSKN